jgi:hypothetical protein
MWGISFGTHRRGVAAIVLAAFAFLGSGASVSAATPLKGYLAQRLAGSGDQTVVLHPGETTTYTIQFKNFGTVVWANSGPAYVSVYTYTPKYRTSVFYDASWKASDQPVVMKEQNVSFGGTGTISFKLHAPKTVGSYSEDFNLAADDVAWIPGGLFTVNIDVQPATTKTPAVSPAPAPAPSTTQAPPTVEPAPAVAPSGLAALVLIRSAKTVVAKGGEEVSYSVGIKNTGTVPWVKRELRTPDVQAASVGDVTMDSSWLAPNVVTANAGDAVVPGGLEYFSFKFKAPPTAGTHTVKYVMAVNDSVIPDFSVDIPVDVTSGAPDALNAPIRNDLPPLVPTVGTILDMTEPTIRVGILIVDSEVNNQVKISCASDWALMGGDGGLLSQMKAGQAITAFYKKGRYWYDRGLGMEKTDTYLRFVPDEANAVCTVLNWDRSVTRGSDRPYNAYRNVLELHYNGAKNRTWLINELPMEYYLRGLGETSNVSPAEFQKALVTVARTYALYLWERDTKHADEYFNLSGYADDQVYRGYDQEAASPNIVSAVTGTHGDTVTSQGKTAITPYFSSSDGHTRSWSDVWGGDVPYVIGKPAPCDAENHRRLRGHGVGLSASEALCMANQGSTWDQIIHYFYTGVDISQRWP